MSKKLETVETLMKTMERALGARNIDEVRETCAKLGPHTLTLERNLVACKAADDRITTIRVAGMARISANSSKAHKAVGVMPIEQAAEAASALQMNSETIAERIDEVLRIADAQCEMDVVKRITEWLTKKPEFGLLINDPSPPATWRPVRTWRLHEVYPETALTWSETAENFMKDQRMRHGRS